MTVGACLREGLYLGLISGTSMDGVDAVAVELGPDRLHTVAALTHAYAPALRRRLHEVIAPDARLTLHELASLDIAVGRAFAAAATAVLQNAGRTADEVIAIGSHGQTLRHGPHEALPYTVQIGDPATITAGLGAITVADFRSLDIAYGGEGAPLVPPFHAWALRSATENRVIANVGGIANLTLLSAGSAAPGDGFDSGPGNCLMDEWSMQERGLPYDDEGAWAARGSVSQALLTQLLAEPYYAAPPPKSTGREVFNLAYLRRHLRPGDELAAVDVQATLAELTVETLAREIERSAAAWASGVTALYVCGGGARNRHLMTRLAQRLAPLGVHSTSDLGLDPCMIEATAFAWLAAMRVSGQPVTLTTGARVPALLLGGVYRPAP